MARKTFVFLSLLIMIVGVSFAQAPDTLWTKIYGDTDYERGNSLIKIDDGGFAIVGATDALFASGSIQDGNMWLVRLDSIGDTLWTKTYGGSGIDEGNSIHNTFDGGFILAGGLSNNLFFYNAWLVRTDSNGDTLWTNSYAKNTEGYATSVIETSDSGFVFTGTVNTQITLSKDVWLVKTDAAGDTIWSKTFGESGQDIGNAVKQTADGGFIVTGNKRLIGQERDVYLIRTDENGDTLWTKSYNGPSPNSVDEGRDIHQLSDNGFMILGFSNAEVWLLRTNSNGDTLWTKRIPGNCDTFQKTSDGGFIIAGGNGLIRTDSEGNTLWIKTLDALVNSVQQTIDGGFVVTGYTLLNATKDDLWIARLASDGATAVEDENNEIPIEYGLSQNYPNPFNPKTKIVFNISEFAYTTLKIYDVLGNEITTLINEQKSPGIYEVIFDAHNLPSGIYFYSLLSGNFSETKKLVLMK